MSAVTVLRFTFTSFKGRQALSEFNIDETKIETIGVQAEESYHSEVKSSIMSTRMTRRNLVSVSVV